jgi:hypothetical protein
MKPKAEGLKPVFDNQLKTPEHDRLMCMLLDESIKDLICKMYNCEPGNENAMKLEVPIFNGPNKFLIGIIDAVYYGRADVIWDDGKKRKCGIAIPIEIKPHILSIGDTLRQLNIYKSYLNDHEEILLITQDEQYREIFESQDFKYMVL